VDEHFAGSASISPWEDFALTFAEFLEFKQQQLEDDGLLKAMQETKDDETIELADAKLYLDSLTETLRER
jgi:hypothetical protein